MANELSTLGVVIKTAYEVSSGVRPTTNYVTIAHIKAVPDLAVAPSGIEVTDLSETNNRRYVPGLKDYGDSLGFTANLTSDLITTWETLVTTAATKWASGLATWFEVYVPTLGKSFYFSGNPVQLGISSMEVNAALETTLYITPQKFEGFAAVSTTTS